MKAKMLTTPALGVLIAVAVALNWSLPANSAEKTPAAAGSETAQKKPKEVWEKLVDEYFVFAPETIAATFTAQARFGHFDPFQLRAYMLSNKLSKRATLSGLAKEYGQPDKKEVGILDGKVNTHRWWWGPVAFDAPNPKKPIEGHGLDVAWIHNLNNKDTSAAFGEVPGGVANVALGNFLAELAGGNKLSVTNPHPFTVTVLLRSGVKGLDLSVPAKQFKTVFVPDGNYNMFFIFGDRPKELYQGDSFALNGYGVEFRVASGVTNNYRIRKAR